jgi:dTDP-4-dehydrorhamnose reductase
MSTIFVTGANGQLGSELQKLSGATGHRFIFTDIDTLDATNFSALDNFCQSKKIDFIINCAAYTAVDKAESESDKAFLINRDAVKNLAQLANSKNAVFIHISTDYVFDGANNTPYKETEKVNPLSVYGKSKVEGEIEALKYDRTVVIRTAWLYSSFGNNIVKTILRLSAERDVLKFIFDQTGTPTYAGDLAQAIIQIVDDTEKKGLKPGIYHYTNEGVCSWFDVAWEIVNFTKSNCKIEPIETHEFKTAAQRPQYGVLNKQKIKDNFGIEIPYWKTSLFKCLKILTNKV